MAEISTTTILKGVFRKAMLKHEKKYVEIAQKHGGMYIPSSLTLSFWDRSALTHVAKEVDPELVWELRTDYDAVNKDYLTLSAFMSARFLMLHFIPESIYLLPDFLLTFAGLNTGLLSNEDLEIRDEFLNQYYTDEIQAMLIKHSIILK